MTAKRPRKKARWLWIFPLLIALEFIPGRYTLDDAQDEFDLDDWEGITLLALSSVDLSIRATFEEETRHRISRNAEIIVPAGTTLVFDGWMEPKVEKGEVVARADRGELRADKPLTFIYRGVTVALAKILRTKADDPQNRMEAIGQYRVLTALATAYRYHRQKKVRREYQAPTRAEMDLSVGIRPSYSLEFPGNIVVVTGSEPGRLRVVNAVYDQGKWVDGIVELSASLANPEPAVNAQLGVQIPNIIEISDSMSVLLRKIRDLEFVENRINLRVDGELTLSEAFKPDFTGLLGFDLLLPSGIALNEAEVGVELASIRDLDINRANPLIDKMVRGTLRSRKEDVQVRVHLGEEFPEIAEWPAFLFLEEMKLEGTPEGGPRLTLRAELR